jgi:predicted signal transduction protein with EAL and GGDEF domain
MPKRHVILCVDDEPQILKGLAPTLSKKYLVKTAASGSAALGILRTTPAITVIISDMRMPSMNGAQFLSASRQIAPNARRILLTGHADVATALAAVNEGGICRLLTKPCPVAEVVEAVEEAIADCDAEARDRAKIRRSAERNVLRRDALTGLASRNSLIERLDSYRGRRRTDGWPTEVVFCIEIANIDELAGGYESRTTDQAMHSVVARLRSIFAPVQCLARYKLDTFVALIELEDSSDAIAEELARRVVRTLERPIEVDGNVLQYRARVGIARTSIDRDDPRVVLRYAELAARQASQAGHDSICFFSQELRERDELRSETIRALRIAIAENQLHLHYQPIIDIEHNRVYSIEALARWEHAQLGVISPATFIPLAEKAGLMTPLGGWVLNRACADAPEFGGIFRRVSVNVSVTQILDSRFIHALSHAIERNGIEPSALVLEVTESAFAEDLDKVCSVLSEVRRLGVSIAIDDFGAGYSSLAYLSRLPVDSVKIDAVFVRDFNRGGEAIIGAALAVAQKLQIEAVVEGIETADSLDTVRRLGATKVQGYLFARPMPATMLRRWHSEFAARQAVAV